MKASPDNIKDIDKYYMDTYIRVPEVDPEDLFYVRSVQSTGLIVKSVLKQEEGIIHLSEASPYTIQNPLVNRAQWVSHGDSAFFVARIPARMWKKGVCSSNTRISKLNNLGGLSSENVSQAGLSALAKTPTYTDTLSHKKKGVSIFSKDWVLQHSTGRLYFLNFLVGKVSNNGKRVVIPREYTEIALPDVFKKSEVVYV